MLGCTVCRARGCVGDRNVDNTLSSVEASCDSIVCLFSMYRIKKLFTPHNIIRRRLSRSPTKLLLLLLPLPLLSSTTNILLHKCFRSRASSQVSTHPQTSFTNTDAERRAVKKYEREKCSVINFENCLYTKSSVRSIFSSLDVPRKAVHVKYVRR